MELSQSIPPDYIGDVFVKKTIKGKRKRRNRCSVPGCSAKNDKTFSCHSFPKDKKLRKLWKIKCRIFKDIPKNYLVCGNHFLKTDFCIRHITTIDLAPRSFLKKNAVPSQNLPVASHTRVKNVVQNRIREQRMIDRRLKKEMPHMNIKEEMKEPNGTDKEIQLKIKSEANSTYLDPGAVLQVEISEPKKGQDKGVQLNNTDTLPRANVMSLLTTKNKLNAWTGIATFVLLRKIEKRVRNALPQGMEGNGLTVLEQILLCFINLKTKLDFVCLSSIFNTTTSSVFQHFNSMLPFIKEALADFNYFSSRFLSTDNEVVTLRMYGYDEVRALLDSTEEKAQKCDSATKADIFSTVDATRQIRHHILGS